MLGFFDNDIGRGLGAIVLIALTFFIVIWLAPVVTFWAIGVLFGYHIPLTWGTFWAFWAIRLFAIASGYRSSK